MLWLIAWRSRAISTAHSPKTTRTWPCVPTIPIRFDSRGDILYDAGRDDDAVAVYRKGYRTQARLQ